MSVSPNQELMVLILSLPSAKMDWRLWERRGVLGGARARGRARHEADEKPAACGATNSWGEVAILIFGLQTFYFLKYKKLCRRSLVFKCILVFCDS